MMFPPMKSEPDQGRNGRDKLQPNEFSAKQQPQDGTYRQRHPLLRRVMSQGEPILLANLRVEENGNGGRDQTRKNSSDKHTPASPLYRPERQGDPKQKQQMRLDRNQNASRSRE